MTDLHGPDVHVRKSGLAEESMAWAILLMLGTMLFIVLVVLATSGAWNLVPDRLGFW